MLSCSCFGATLLWYKSTERSSSLNSGEIPLAQVGRVSDQVLKRPATRLLWQTVNTGDYLFNGETIRTSSMGEIRIQFEDSRYIDLEPDSLVVLQTSKGEIALDLMEGSVFVNAKNDGSTKGPGLVLNSANGKVDLSGASASLSKGKGDAFDLQVLEGSATIKDKDGRSKEVNSGSSSSLGANGVQDSFNLQVISPSPQKPYFIDPDAEKSVTFQWKGFPPQYNVVLMAGITRKEQRDWATTAKPGLTEIQTKFPIGKYFWKLVAKDPASGQIKGESSVFKTEFIARLAPTVIFPVVDAEFPVEKFPTSLLFKWQKGEEASKISLEVSTDKQLKNKLVYKAFAREETFNLQNLKEGEYYWRLSAYYPESDKPVLGKIQKFKLMKPVRKDPVRIKWELAENMTTQNYVDQPLLQLTWKPENRQEDIAGYRLDLIEETGTNTEPIKFQSKETNYKANIPRPGRYVASIEALDKEGNSLGRSENKTLTASQIPLLPAPKIFPEEGVLKSQGDGRSDIKWEPLPGAKEYQLVVSDNSGKELASRRYQATSTSLRNLMPGQYSLKLIAIDQHGRVGQEGPARTLVVPDRSDLKAPKLKKIKVN